MSIGSQLASYDLGKENEKKRILKVIDNFFNESLDECIEELRELKKTILQENGK